MAIKSPKESKADVLHQAASDMKLETNETSMCVPLGPPDDICLCYHVNADLCEGNHYLSDQSLVSVQPAKASQGLEEIVRSKHVSCLITWVYIVLTL